MVYLNSSPCIEKMEFCINRYPICKEKKNALEKTKIKHNFHGLKINQWSIRTSNRFMEGYFIFRSFLIGSHGIFGF